MKSVMLILSLVPCLLTNVLAESKPISAEVSQSVAAAETDADSTANEALSNATADGELAEQVNISRGQVTRSMFTSGVQDREPVDDIEHADSTTDQVYYFTELQDMSGQTAIHRWEYNGEVVAEISFAVKGPRWRVWSKKSLVPEFSGEWKVSVVNGAGEVIAVRTLKMATLPVAPPLMNADTIQSETVAPAPVE